VTSVNNLTAFDQDDQCAHSTNQCVSLTKVTYSTTAT